jgi:hypothetical protein
MKRTYISGHQLSWTMAQYMTVSGITRGRDMDVGCSTGEMGHNTRGIGQITVQMGKEGLCMSMVICTMADG